jgi:hypothetical protein
VQALASVRHSLRRQPVPDTHADPLPSKKPSQMMGYNVRHVRHGQMENDQSTVFLVVLRVLKIMKNNDGFSG